MGSDGLKACKTGIVEFINYKEKFSADRMRRGCLGVQASGPTL